MRRALATVTALALVLALLLLWPRPVAEEASSPSPELARSVLPVRNSPAPTAIPAAEQDTDTDEPEPSPYLAAHAAIAEAFGYVAISCWVGTEYDADDYVGYYRQKVANGWYTNVVTRLEGEQVVERRFERPGVPEDAKDFEKADFEAMFIVSWKADAPGSMVPCEVRPVQYATLRVRVVDEDGVPLPRVSVCCPGGEADDDGLVEIEQLRAGRPYRMRGWRSELDFASQSGDRCEGAMTVESLEADETREVELQLSCLDFSAVMAGETHPADDVQITAGTEEGLPELSRDEELERLRALESTATIGEEGQKLIDSMIRHRERILERERVSEEIRRRIDETKDPVERQRLWDELLETYRNP